MPALDIRSVTPLLFFGGPTSNLQALEALLAEAARRGISAESIVSTGDLAAYCGDPAAVVSLVRGAGIRVVRGNCEEQLAEGAPDCGCGFAPGGACDRLASSWYAHALAQLSAADRAFLGAAPERIGFTLNGVRFIALHGSARSVNRFVFASTPSRVKALDLDALGVDGIVGGHSGLPFTHMSGGRFWHNPGALGLPANDGTPRVWFSVISPGAAPGRLVIEHAALDYDHAGAADAMARAGLPPDYAQTLRTGRWPNCDILPAPETKAAGKALTPCTVRYDRAETADAVWPPTSAPARLAPEKFRDAAVTAKGEPRAHVALERLETLWINTGTVCNLACANCYIESSPRNDRLSYISQAEAAAYLDEIEMQRLGTRVIGFTGGEPFMNPALIAILGDALSRGFEALVLTNAMKPMRRRAADLLALKARFGAKLALRVSVDHYSADLHEMERGRRSFEPTMEGLSFLARNGFAVTAAGRLFSGEGESVVRAGFAKVFADRGIALDAFSAHDLVLFPEMDAGADVPEITDACWFILGVSPSAPMCASSRMVVKRRGAEHPTVAACTLLPYDPAFDLGPTLAGAARAVPLNHPHCAAFCVLGGASCSAS